MDRDEKLVQKLHNGDVASYMLVRDNPNDYSPFVLFYLGFGLFNSGYHEEGATWYYVAQLRARYDANRTLDKTTGAGVKVLSNRYGEKINKWAFEDPERVQLVGKTAINFVAGNDEAYHPGWLVPHGIEATRKAISGAKEYGDILEPRSKWPQIKAESIATYLEGMEGAITMLKELRAQEPQ